MQSSLMRFGCRAFVLLTCVCSLSTLADAQRRPGKPSPGGMVGILFIPSVLRELGIQEETPTFKELRELGNVIAEEKREVAISAKGDQDQYQKEALRNIDIKHRAELRKLLTEEQYLRLQQITLQALGYSELTDPDVVSALSITSEQITKIDLANRELAKQQKEYFANLTSTGKSPSSEVVNREIGEFVSAYNKVIAETLTSAQSARLQEMQGQPHVLVYR